MSTAIAHLDQDLALDAIKTRQRAVWASGDYAVIGTTLQIVGEQLCETMDLAPGSRVLDVAAGNGNAALAAARRHCRVVATDYVPALLEQARRRAAAEGLALECQVADAEALPFADARFDAVVSTFGVMFAPHQAVAARELVRVCRPGGTIALANWTPEGFIGQLFKLVGGYVPPPPGVAPPARWGTAAALETWFGPAAAALELVPRQFAFRYLDADHFIEVFRNWYGPVHRAFVSAGERADDLRADLRELLLQYNSARDGTLIVRSDYIDAVIRLR